MPSAANLTRAVAEHRSATVELADHAIHLDLTGAPDSTQSTFTSTSTITLVSSESSVEIDLVAAQSDRLAAPQPVAIHHEQKEMVTDAVPPDLGAIQQGGDLGFVQEIPAPLVRIGRRC